MVIDLTLDEEEEVTIHSEESLRLAHRPLKRKRLIDLSPKSDNLLSSAAREESIEFEDEDFPPNGISIGKLSVNTFQIHISCKCNMKCSLKTVSKSGPNQGRFFLSCGRERKCNFFQWIHSKDILYDNASIVWRRFRAKDGWKLLSSSSPPQAEAVQQGKVGDCWFLSALSVLATRQDLILNILLNQKDIPLIGKLTFKLFIDGIWKYVTVDNFLPCSKASSSSSSSSSSSFDSSQLLFSNHSHSQLWVPYLEKAYAKAHGSYGSISGGEISEAFHDLTGCPVESIDLNHQLFNSETTWTLLLHFSEQKFPMGCATNVSGEGIVGHHAYSLLEVVELDGALAKERHTQRSILEYTSSSSSSSPSSYLPFEEDLPRYYWEEERHSLRLLKIRNPWGKREFDGGDFSTGSDRWTAGLRDRLLPTEKNDGLFWMTYHDFLRRFVRIDVCRAYYPPWKGVSFEASILPASLEADTEFTLSLDSTTSRKLSLAPVKVLVWLVQKTKRGKGEGALQRRYWYSDLSMIVIDESNGSLVACQCSCPVRNTSPLELEFFPSTCLLVRVVHFNVIPNAESFFLRIYSSFPVHCNSRSTVANPSSFARSITDIFQDALSYARCSEASSRTLLPCTCLYQSIASTGEVFIHLLFGTGIRFVKLSNVSPSPVIVSFCLHLAGYRLHAPMSLRDLSPTPTSTKSIKDGLSSFACHLGPFEQRLCAVLVSKDDDYFVRQECYLVEESVSVSTVSDGNSFTSPPPVEILPLFKSHSLF